MNYYKILECKNYQEINQELIDFVIKNNLGSSVNFWNPVDIKELYKACQLFKQWIIDTKIPIKSVAVTVGNKISCCGPHVDTPPARYKLSWPILNTQQTFNRWYKIKDETIYKINELGGKFYNIDNLEEIESIEVLAPMIIDAGIPHDVYIKEEKFPRLGLQCQLFKEPDSL